MRLTDLPVELSKLIIPHHEFRSIDPKRIDSERKRPGFSLLKLFHVNGKYAQITFLISRDFFVYLMKESKFVYPLCRCKCFISINVFILIVNRQLSFSFKPVPLFMQILFAQNASKKCLSQETYMILHVHCLSLVHYSFL
jgi:hypothetical protein